MRVRETDGWARRLAAIAFEVLVVGSALVLTILAASTALARSAHTGGVQLAIAGGGAVVIAFLGPFALPLRRRFPLLALVLSCLAVVFPIGPLAGFALPEYVRRARLRDAIGVAGLYVAGLAIWFVRDTRGPTPETSALRLMTSDVDAKPTLPAEMSLAGLISLFVVLVLVPVGLGALLRAKDQLAGTKSAVAKGESALAAQRERAGQMSAALSRKDEREMIAREVHDALGHRLSMINVYAGGLEVAAAGDPELAGHARLVREAAQETVDDLRDLVRIMRDPQQAVIAGNRSLADVQEVVDEVLTAGYPCSAAVMVDDPGAAPPVLTLATYRIVQELLTNARKHAPGAPVRLRVTGGPGAGLSIEVDNPVGPGPGGGDGGGSGLVGVRERADALGGTMTAEETDGAFRVRVWLPFGQ